MPPHGTQHLLRTVAHAALSQAAGRVMLTALRFAVVVVIARRAGLDSFGAYALVLGFIVVAEWIADFGQTDIAVRDIAAGAGTWPVTLGALAVAKIGQGLLAALAAWGAVVVLGYGPAVTDAMLLAAAAVLLYAGVLVYRAAFRAQMRMDKDVGAELAFGVVLLLATWQATAAAPSLSDLVLCYVGARAAHLLAASVLARGLPRLAFGRGVGREAVRLAWAAWPVGVAGLLVSTYDAMDAAVLASASSSAEVGVFTVASRLLMLSVIVVQALGVAVFPVLSAQWQADRGAFQRTAQATLDTALLLGGLVFCAFWCGAAGLADFFKHDRDGITTVLQILSWAILARVMVTIFGPMVVISGRQIHTLWMTALVVAAKGLALWWLVPGAGAVGAAGAYLVSEVAVGLLPTILLCQCVTGVRLDWRVPLRLLAAAAAVVGVAHALAIEATLLQGLLGALAFAALAAAVGAVPVDDLRRVRQAILQRRQPEAGA